MITDFSKLSIDTILDVVDLIEIPIFIIEIKSESLVFRKLNKHYEEKVGMRSADIEGKTAREFLPPRVAETVEDNYWHCAKTRASYEYEELLKVTDEEIWWSTTLSPVMDRQGQVKYIIGLATDVTKHKNSTMDLVSENSRLKRQNDDITTLTAIAAHDLRPAIGNVRTFSELVMEGFQDLGDGKLQKLQTIHSISDIMTDYVERILGHARSVNIRKGECTCFDLNKIIKDIIAASDPASEFEISHPSGHVEGEIVVFQIILRNLMDNATRYARSRIAVDIRNSIEHTGNLVLSVSDDGDGFPGGASGFRAHMRVAGNSQHRTTGFGLRVVQQLAETRDGHFWLDAPRLGKGATMCVSIPGILAGSVTAPKLHLIETDNAA